jgi:WD40 repeat protein
MDSSTGEAIFRLRQGDVSEVIFSPDGRILAAAGLDGGVSLYDVATGQKVVQFSDLKAEVRHLQFSADGRRLAAVGFSKGQAYPQLEYADGTEAPAGRQYSVQLRVWDASDKE